MGNNIIMDTVPKRIVAFTANGKTCCVDVNGIIN